MTPRHLVSVWNPSYAQDAMDAHLETLLSWAESASETDDVYVWWAKLKSGNRQQPLPHREEILALDEQIQAGVETHLYLTDYRSLYVALIDEITTDDLLADAGESDHMPLYYQGQMADFWFRLLDIRLLVSDDTVATIEELKRLRNVRYQGRPISLYGGMVELPLIATRDEETSWFSDRDELTGGMLWAQHDAALRGEVERLGRELRDNLLSREVWALLEPPTRTFLAAGEAVFRARREDPRFDFSGPAVSYAKAVETEVNATLFRLLRKGLARTPLKERVVNLAGRTEDLLGPLRHQTLGALRRLLSEEEPVRTALRAAAPTELTWWTLTLPRELALVEEMRNPAAHSAAAGRQQVAALREQILGIGCGGWIVQLARAKDRAL
jgi:hypothetical protein